MTGHKKQKSKRRSFGNNYFPIITFVMTGILVYFSFAYKPSWTYNWTGIRSNVKDTVLLIEEYGSVTSFGVGYSSTTPQQWYRRLWLIGNGNESELLKLTDYPNGAVKAMAYEALLRKKHHDKLNILKKALNDTTTFVNYVCGCLGETLMLGEYLVENVLYLRDNSPSQPTGFYDNFGLSKVELNDIRLINKQKKQKKNYYIEKYYDYRK